jgi:hypothetical protein
MFAFFFTLNLPNHRAMDVSVSKATSTLTSTIASPTKVVDGTIAQTHHQHAHNQKSPNSHPPAARKDLNQTNSGDIN